LSNEILYRFPDRMNIICREKGGYLKCSLRSKKGNLPDNIKRALSGLDGYGGGHDNACGLSIKKEDFNKFLSRIKG
ncbi:MAG: DHH family phosphoesterase, partial [Candidatus Micrarchaeia archaeon]